jgi:hypothetical protein
MKLCILYVDLVQYSHLVTCVVVGPNAILSSILPNLACQELFLSIQDEHEDVMDDNEWVNEGSKWCCKVDTCTCSYVAKWLFCKHLE